MARAAQHERAIAALRIWPRASVRQGRERYGRGAGRKWPDEKYYAGKAQKIRANYLRKFYHADQGNFATNSQCSNALALALNIVEPQDKQRVLYALIENLKANSYGMTAADVGSRYVLL